MTEYIDKIGLLLDIAELPNDASKKDVLRKIYEYKAKNLISCGIGQYTEELTIKCEGTSLGSGSANGSGVWVK